MHWAGSAASGLEMIHLWPKPQQLQSVRYMAGSGWKGTFLTALELIQICMQGELSQRWIGGVVVGIERFVLPACVDLGRLTSETCLGETPLEQVQEITRLAARSVRQRALQYSAGRGRSGAVAWRGTRDRFRAVWWWWQSWCTNRACTIVGF